MEIEEWLGADNTLGIEIWNKKYRNGDESFDEWLDRVSGKDEEVKRLIREKKFLFAGRILSNRGTRNHGTYSNCYVLSVKDSIDSIFDTAKEMALTYKAGGGVGIDISNLAPEGARVNNPARTSTGAISFIDLFTTTTGLIGQNGRRGAAMISLSCDHPDIDKFIELKTDVNKATTANLSIRVSDAFMMAVENDEDWYCAFTRPETGECIYKTYKARDLFKIFCDANYDFGEPGLLFWDTVEKYNQVNTYSDFKYAGVNPCGEEMLPDGGACLLGSMNLAAYVGEDKQFDFVSFKKDVKIAIRALDTVLDEGILLHPLQIQKETATAWRQVGLGIMGLGDMLIKRGIRYGSNSSLVFCDLLGKIMAEAALEESEELGQKLGSFPRFNAQKTAESSFYYTHFPNYTPNAMRNSQLLAIAPTGSLSTMLGISGGIEPLFALEYTRTTKSLNNKEETYIVVPKVVQEARDRGDEDCLICAQTLDYKERIAMQSVWQKHIDSSISSTINLPEDFPKEAIYDLYMLAWEKGLKGVTVFRDGCKRAGILNVKRDEKKDDEIPVLNSVVQPIEAKPENLIGKKRKLMTGCGSLHVSAFFDRDTGDLFELFLSKGSLGGCHNYMTGVSRLISLSARAGCTVDEIVDQLRSCGACPSYAVRRATKGDTSIGSCCPMAVGNALEEMHNEMMAEIGKGEIPDAVVDAPTPKTPITNPCPQCGAELQFTNGCASCPSCGYSKCS